MAEALKRGGDAESRRIILIVEDDEVLRMVLRIEFEKNGFNVREADNGKVGLASMGEMQPDAIITDIEMPVMDGFNFIRAVRNSRRDAAVPIIAISALRSDGMTEKAVAAGANRFCEKPLAPSILLALVNGYLSDTAPLSN